MTLKTRIDKIRNYCKRIYIFTLPYFFVMFFATYAMLALFREFCGPGLIFILSVSMTGFGLWNDDETLKANFAAMLVISMGVWFIFLCLSFIIRLPVIGEGAMLAFSLSGAASAFLEYNQEIWERKQIRS